MGCRPYSLVIIAILVLHVVIWSWMNRVNCREVKEGHSRLAAKRAGVMVAMVRQFAARILKDYRFRLLCPVPSSEDGNLLSNLVDCCSWLA